MSLLDKDITEMTTASNYKFSATKIGSLGASEYTICGIVNDVSGSVDSYAAQLEGALKTVLKACQKSPRADNLMIRLTKFATNITEVHGFKLLGSIKDSDYDGVIKCGGGTSLYDAVHEAVEATAAYGKQLIDQEFMVNGIIIIITDGRDESHTHLTPASIKKAIEKAKSAEVLESLMVVLVGVTDGNATLSTYLQDFQDGAGITQYVDIGSATPGKIAKMAAFVSQSISSASSALGSGGPSQPLQPANFKI